MSVEQFIREELIKVDEYQRRSGREALRGMVRTGQITESGMENAVAVRRGARKTIRHLTVQDLIDMGIVTLVADSEPADEAVA